MSSSQSSLTPHVQKSHYVNVVLTPLKRMLKHKYGVKGETRELIQGLKVECW
jgi:hypothetical protein